MSPLYTILALLVFANSALALKEGKCEGKNQIEIFFLLNIQVLFIISIVCVGVVNKLINKLSSEEKQNPQLIEDRFRELCLDTKKAENRFVSLIS